ncbi:hypothetical protein ACFLZO_01020, partial [Patescibacteria group bacterium]
DKKNKKKKDIPDRPFGKSQDKPPINPILGAVDTFIDRSREVVDPIKKVCYPVYETAKISTARLSDPVKKICYEPFLVHYEKKYKTRFPKHHGKLLILDLFLMFVIGALVVAGIFSYFITPILPQADVMSLHVDVPEKTVSGAQTAFTLNYLNDSDKPISCADMLIEVPDDFVLFGINEPLAQRSENCADIETTVVGNRIGVRLGEIPPFGRGSVTVQGALYGSSGDTRTLSAQISFWEEAGTAPVRVPLVTDLIIDDSLLALDLEMPEAIMRGRVVALHIPYENTGDLTLSGVHIQLDSPSDFVITGASPSRTDHDSWKLGDLEPGDAGIITAWGYLRSAYFRRSAANFTAHAFVTNEDTTLLIEKVQKNADPLSSGFELTHEIPNISGTSHLFPGDNVEIRVTYANTGEEPLSDMSVTVEGSPALLAPSEAASVTWNKATTPALALVKPGESGTLTTTFVLNDTVPVGALFSDSAPVATFTTRGEATRGDESTHPIFSETQPTDIQLATRITPNAAAVYYTSGGDQLGLGPLPPVAYETTKYWIFLNLENSTNTVENAVFEATLPDNVEWTGRFSVISGEALDFLPLTRTVRWSLSSIPASVLTGRPTSAQFEIAVTPTEDQIGTEIPLITNIRVTGRDTGIDAKLHAEAPDVVSDTVSDEVKAE